MAPVPWRSKLLHPSASVPAGFRSLVPPVHRGSTVLFPNTAAIVDDWRQREFGYTYGLYGTPTTLQLGARIAELEGAHHSFVVPGGQAAIALIYLALCRSGDHALVPANAYGPNRRLAEDLLDRLGIEVESYDPRLTRGGGPGIVPLFRSNTALIWCESPGSVTMEVPDLPAIVAAAHARNVPVALDNTYAAGVLLDAFALGVDVSMQALTKYVGGHSDLLLGTVSVSTPGLYERIGEIHQQLGMAVSPDDCSLALRGLETLAVRLDRLESSTLRVAGWLALQPEIQTVLHPALPSCPGHQLWKRDFSGSASLFSVVFPSRVTPDQVNRFVDSLTLFGIGYSWGGTHSLVMTYPTLERPGITPAGRLVRFNIGLEEPDDLIADLAQALHTAISC